MKRTFTFSLLFIGFTLPVFGQRTITVDLQGSGDFTEIQPAIDAAIDGDIVLVKPGEYVITESLTFNGKAITAKGENGAAETVVRKKKRGSVIVFQDEERSDSVLDGFTLTGGRTVRGGGILCRSTSSPTVKSCVITANMVFQTDYFALGAGVHCDTGASPSFVDCIISDNVGSGVSCHNASPTLRNCMILRTSGTVGFALIGGEGIICRGDSAPLLINCIISDNFGALSRARGFAVSCDDTSSPTLIGCEISRNSSSRADGGGGIRCGGNSSPTLISCRITNNAGAGLSCDQGRIGDVWVSRSTPALTNCTIAGNAGEVAILSTGEALPTLRNCIVWGNSGGSIRGNSMVTFTCVQGDAPGEGNINADPLFVDPTAGDYRLQPDSPAIDTGTSEGAPASDLDGNARPCGSGVDMGAYEFCEVPQPAVPFLRGDVNSDGQVSLSDALMLRRWLSLGGHPPVCLDTADADDNGQLDGADADGILEETFSEDTGEFSIAEPYPAPGADPTIDDLVCSSYQPAPPAETDDLIRLCEVSASPGQQVEVPIFIRSSREVEAYQIVVRYDPDVLRPLGGALDLEGTFYEDALGGDADPFVRVQPFPEEGTLVVGFAGSLDQKGFGVPAGKEILVGKIPALVSTGALPGQDVPILLVGSSGDLHTELTSESGGELVTVRPAVEGSTLRIVADITFFRGDANSDQSVNVSDAVFTLDYLYAGGRRPVCPDAADANDDGSIEISDVITVFNELFDGSTGGIAPPYPEKGSDPTEDELPACGPMANDVSVCGVSE